MGENGKRKGAPTGGGQQTKKKKTGNAGKWKTPHQQSKMSGGGGGGDAVPQPGDTGIWVTCARHQENKAAREIGVLFAEYAEKMYGIKSVHDTEPAGASGGGEEGGEEEEVDIEAAIRKEVAALTAKPDPGSASSSGDGRMTPVKMNVDCLLFVKTPSAVDPVPFVRRICEDAMRCEEIPGLMRCRYVNRVTPVSVMGKANEQGLLEVAKEAMGKVFDLSGKRSLVVGGQGAADAAPSKEAAGETGAPEGEASNAESGKKPFTFAIRPTIRNHSNLKRDVVINTIAGLVNDDLHKVNLTAPDKVILVEIFQNVCGISVVDGDWEELKRFNLTELYSQARKNASAVASTD